MERKKISPVLITVIVLVVAIVIALFWGISLNNSIVKLEESVNQNKAEIDNQLKRRADLIPNLVNTVKGISSQEQKIVDSITESREKMVNGSTQDKLNANSDFTKSLNIILENYPEIKSDKSYIALQDELAGTENRIAVARKSYNDGIKEFNTTIKTFPNSLIAGMFGHSAMPYLEISSNDAENPEVKF